MVAGLLYYINSIIDTIITIVVNIYSEKKLIYLKFLNFFRLLIDKFIINFFN